MNEYELKEVEPSAILLLKALGFCYVIISKALVPLGLANGMVVTVSLLLFVFAVLYLDNWKVFLTSFYRVEFVFIFITALTSVVVCKDLGLALSTVQTLLYGICFGYSLLRTSIKSGEIDWFVKAYVVAGYILAGYLFVTGGVSLGRLARLSISQSMNVNTLGVYLMFCIWGVLYLLSTKVLKQNKKISSIDISVAIGSICIFFYFVLGTGSRKAFIASTFIMVIWLFFCLALVFKRLPSRRRLWILGSIIVVVVFVIVKFGDKFSNIAYTMTMRFELLSEEEISNMHRMKLIKDAWRVFLKYPVVGVGWNNYRFYSFSAQYSHCTFIEVLACTGVSGGLFAYALFYNLFSIIRKSKSYLVKIEKILVILLLVVLLFIDWVQIMYYNQNLLMFFHLLYVMVFVAKEKQYKK